MRTGVRWMVGLAMLVVAGAVWAKAQAPKADDWPNLLRYRQANVGLGAPAAGEQRVVFMGDSITDAWANRFATAFAGKPYVGRGISGQTTPQMVLRFQQDVIRLRPEVVVILAGINDIAENTGPETMDQIEDNFRAMVEMAKAAHIRVVLCSVLPAAEIGWHTSIDPKPKVLELNAWLEGYARTEKAGFVNYYPALVDDKGGLRKELGNDAVHPNAAGYAVMEPMVSAAIAKALATRRP